MEIKVSPIEFHRLQYPLEKVGIYCRVSSTSPAQINSLSSQASYLLQYAMSHGGWAVIDIYIDISSGSAIEKRPEFRRMLEDIKNNKITKIVTKSVSRFGRNTSEVLATVRAITLLGGSVFFEGQDLDIKSTEGELYLSLYASIAQDENQHLSENIKWGIKKRARDGSSALYNRPCYGYRVNNRGDLEIAADKASVVREIFSMYVQGLSVVKIKKRLEEEKIPSPTRKPNWSKRTIETILTNKKYIGKSEIYKSYQQGYPEPKRKTNRGGHERYEIDNHHVPIIASEIFEAAQKIRAERTNVEYDEAGRAKRRAKKYSAARVVLAGEEKDTSELNTENQSLVRH